MRWSPRVRIPLLGRLVTLNIGRRGASTSLKLGPLTLNSRGTYSFNGPSILDFRGKWRGSARGKRAGKPGEQTCVTRTARCPAKLGGEQCTFLEKHWIRRDGKWSSPGEPVSRYHVTEAGQRWRQPFDPAVPWWKPWRT